MTSRSSTCCVILKIELELEIQHSDERLAGWNVKRVCRLINKLFSPADWISPVGDFLKDVAENFCAHFATSARLLTFPVTQSLAIAANRSRLPCKWFFFVFRGAERKLVICAFCWYIVSRSHCECNKSSMCSRLLPLSEGEFSHRWLLFYN